MSAEFLVGLIIGTVVTTIVVSRYAANLLEDRLALLLATVTWKFVDEHGKEFDIKVGVDGSGNPE